MAKWNKNSNRHLCVSCALNGHSVCRWGSRDWGYGSVVGSFLYRAYTSRFNLQYTRGEGRKVGQREEEKFMLFLCTTDKKAEDH